MNSFLVKMVFQIVCGNGNHTPQFEEQLRLVFAKDATTAIEKAKQMSSKEAADTDTVKWKFIAVTDIYPFTEDLDGAVLFSKINETEMGAATIHTMKLKETDMLIAFNAVNC